MSRFTEKTGDPEQCLCQNPVQVFPGEGRQPTG
jgi:hypothetical protein